MANSGMEAMTEQLLRYGADPDFVRDILIDKGYGKSEDATQLLEWVESVALRMAAEICSKCGSSVGIHRDGRWEGLCQCCVETDNQASLRDGKCPVCNEDVEFLDKDENVISYYMCTGCGKSFSNFAGWWYI